MSDIHVYSVAYNRPDFLAIQFNTAVKFIKPKSGKMNFTVMINSKNSSMVDQLAEECRKLNIHYIIVPQKEGVHYNAGLTAYNYIRDNFFIQTSKDDYSIIMDSDMFFYNEIDVNVLLDNNDVAAIYHQRQKKFLGFNIYNYEYLWVGFMIFSHKNYNWGNISFDTIDNICDVGGATYYFLKKYFKKGLKVKWLSHTPDITYEFEQIFPSKIINFYNPAMGFQIIEDSIIHYYRGSNWDNNDNELLSKKDVFLKKFLFEISHSSLFEKTSNIYSNLAYSRKHFNGKANNTNDKIQISIDKYH